MLTEQIELDLFDLNLNNNSTKYKIIDLFAGVGGIRLGFEDAFKEKANFVFSSEIDKFAQQSYAANFGEVPDGDITKIHERDVPEFDILLAGFPCQPFSQAGLRKGFDDTRGTLFFDIARIIKHHMPKVVFLENVKGFRGHNKGETFATVKSILEGFGYTVQSQVLNAKHFGVPQNRERIYIIAFLGQETNFTFPDNLNIKVKVGDILDSVVDDKYTISDKIWQSHQRRREQHKAKGNGFGFSLFDHDSRYTSTISARYYKDGAEVLIKQDSKNPRRLTPREAARLQGFPDKFVIPVSDTQAYKQFGNSVAVPVIKSLAKNILGQLTLLNKH